MSKLNRGKLAYLSLVLVFFCWGSVYVANRYILQVLSPAKLACCRFLVSSLALGSILWVRRIPIRVRREDWKYMLFIGFLGYYLSMECTLISVKYAGASLGSLINSLNPVFITLFAAFYLKEELTRWKIFCLVTALIGAGIVSGGSSADPQQLPGVLWGIASVATWARVVMTTRRLSSRYDALIITFLGITASLLFHIPTAGVELCRGTVPNVTPFVVLCILYSGLVGTAIPQLLWNFALSELPASTCSLFYPLMPVFSGLLGVLLLEERLGLRFFLGGALIVSTVVISCLKTKSQ